MDAGEFEGKLVEELARLTPEPRGEFGSDPHEAESDPSLRHMKLAGRWITRLRSRSGSARRKAHSVAVEGGIVAPNG